MPTEPEWTPSKPTSDRSGEQPGRLPYETRTARTSVARADRIPPQDIEAEMSLLGSMMLSRDAIGDVLPLIRRHESDRFYRPDHRRIFETLVDMYDRGDPIDLVTVRNETERLGILKEIGGVLVSGRKYRQLLQVFFARVRIIKIGAHILQITVLNDQLYLLARLVYIRLFYQRSDKRAELGPSRLRSFR